MSAASPVSASANGPVLDGNTLQDGESVVRVLDDLDDTLPFTPDITRLVMGYLTFPHTARAYGRALEYLNGIGQVGGAPDIGIDQQTVDLLEREAVPDPRDVARALGQIVEGLEELVRLGETMRRVMRIGETMRELSQIIALNENTAWLAEATGDTIDALYIGPGEIDPHMPPLEDPTPEPEDLSDVE